MGFNVERAFKPATSAFMPTFGPQHVSLHFVGDYRSQDLHFL